MIDDLLKAMNYEDDCRAQLSAAQALAVAVVSAKSFQKHLERTLSVLRRLEYMPMFQCLAL